MGKKSFNDKLHDSRDLPKIVEISDPKSNHTHGSTRLLIAPPMAYDRIMRTIPFGYVLPSDRLRYHLAVMYGADSTCPLTAGLFISIAARASAERNADETPYWRTLKKDGELNEKYPEGIDGQRRRLEAEGHTIVQRGKRFFVKDYQHKVFPLNADGEKPQATKQADQNGSEE